MKLSKKQIVNGLFIIGIILLVFTPVGFYARVHIGRLLSSGAAVVKEGMQVSLDNYEWDLQDVEGNYFDFRDQEGKVVLINFWATWCPPCVAEMPSLQKLYKGYGDKVVFMFVAQDKPDKVEAFLKKHQYEDLPVYYAKTAAPSLLAAKVLPTTYIIDKDGKIRVAETNAADWNTDKIKTLLGNLLKE
ncbi:TlpA family protein disulfide reductase [Flavobacteriaceae bacterium F89]|uniref:TlpA family protein disulfide reductase n=1 Tax=Cerina litoralis TaxID=2874477 RepID=A0AAE3EQY7_9FLAO|nr:TlpA disulfide reductase family protein [Cerina litoralis]MCG2459507.1 TlpA family protein disulfide reductase [Cerina litoralis]